MSEELAQPTTIEDEYELWKSNVSLMYDFLSETRLLWPTLTVEWLPSLETENIRQEFIIGTLTTGAEKNFLKIAAIDLPEEVIKDECNNDNEKDDDTEAGSTHSKIKIVKKFAHEEEVNRARYMPQNTDLIATINGSGTVFLYDKSKNKQEALVSKFVAHTENGYGLSFNPNIKNQLLSCSDDKTVALWDITNNKAPLHFIEPHVDMVNDCKWSNFNEALFGSVSEDKHLYLYDTRCTKKNMIIGDIQVESSFNTLSFSKHSHNLFAAAGTDSLVYLYDMRNLSKPLHAMEGHTDSVSTLDFSPHRDGIILSSGADRRVITWDITQFGAELPPEDAEDGVPELLMMHGGHRSSVNDFSINPNIPWLVASAEEENILHIWKVSKRLTTTEFTAKYDIKSLE
ncbi:probable Histone acetyltransferase type B subunit 2 [Saccharomycodes ludwigii]|uniref:Probable Histone acetyltransferase type B subunit 2 n=1 Tax=Saccharomycodes ludwigii TaxID=36035 RepID=A0A376B8D9_9ASCO|nr:probable Histone acetyltransferase type B subunit 2 [Saccharomycodes ludwigii]